MNPVNTCSKCQTSNGSCACHNASFTVYQNSNATGYMGAAEESSIPYTPWQYPDPSHYLPVTEGWLTRLHLDDYVARSSRDEEPWTFLSSSLHNEEKLNKYEDEDEAAVKLLLEAKADVKAKDKYDRTALVLAARNECSTAEYPPLEPGPLNLPIIQPAGRTSSDNCLGNQRIVHVSRNFIDLSDPIVVRGNREDIEDLRSTLGEKLNRRWTEGDDHLCALYALEISLRNLFRNNQFARLSSFEYLLGILRSDDFIRLASYQAGQVGNREVDNELNSRNNLSVESIFNVLRILGPNMGETFALGICTPAGESIYNSSTSPMQIYDVYRLFDLSTPPTATVWIHNDRSDSNGLGFTMNHWSGFGVDPPPGVEPPPIVRLPEGDGLYGTNTSHYQQYSRSIDNLARDPVMCKICLKVVQRKSLPKHLKTHNESLVKKEKKYQCLDCQKSFQYPKDLRRHISSTHTGDRSFKCPGPHCKYSRTGFARKDHLQRHIKARSCSTSSVITSSSASGDYGSPND